MTVHILSTLSAPVDYNVYKTAENGAVFVQRTIRINGGANVIDKKLDSTPVGLLTAVSDDDYEVLKDIPVFNIHVNNGFIKVLKKKPVEIEKAVADMEAKDDSAPLTPDSVGAEESQENGVKTVKIGSKAAAKKKGK